MKSKIVIGFILIFILAFPIVGQCQFLEGQLGKYHDILYRLYKEMIPMAKDLLVVSQAVGAFGALWFIGVRVLKHLAAAEPIDFFPLVKPIVVTILISIYPVVLGVMNGVLSPTVIATKEMVKKSNNPVAVLLEQRQKAIEENKEWQDLVGGIGSSNEEWDKYNQQHDEKGESSLGSAFTFSLSIIHHSINVIIKLFVSFLLQILYFAAAICIDSMRTFILLLLSILGPFVLCLSIYDGFQHILPIWIARYVNVYLWLPIANLMGSMIGKIQAEMLKMDLKDMFEGNIPSFGQTDVLYLIFLVVGIVGYFCIPSISNYIVHAAGANTIVSKTNSLILTAGSMAITGGTTASGGGATATAGSGSMSSSNYGNDLYTSSMADAANSEPYHKEGGYNYSKLSGDK
ncbi:conjugative transposon protein TraJ [Chitinophaga niabensis]|uniref:Bacteroides conjugative transposon TraJ protein n=1 Tax=Chitinophaga niabensis TaxID=536979 RepID=A0A1N6KBA0_9BACT|nr:conjugative transposon protein TraJ [Chitinophaga niabensis]SIO53830.1 Bacteroides conjugative transposon TraJ protein [Chitinophaga niabensis]